MENFNNINTGNTISKYSDISTNNIFVLAGGQLSDGKVNNWVKARLDLSIKIYKNKQCNIFCIGGGTYHKAPILNEFNYIIHESTSCANYLVENNINPKHIKKEWSSYDTIANGLFSFTNFIMPLNLKKICLITSIFHMKRTKVIFNKIKKIFNSNVEIMYLETNNNMDNELLGIRNKRENKSIEHFITQMETISNLKEFYHWFYVQHKAYSCLNMYSENINSILRKTY